MEALLIISHCGIKKKGGRFHNRLLPVVVRIIRLQGGMTTENTDSRAVAKTLNFFLKIKVMLRKIEKIRDGGKISVESRSGGII